MTHSARRDNSHAWMMTIKMRILLIPLLLASFACTRQPAPSASDIEGAWLGALDVPPGIKLRLVFHLAVSGNRLTGTMDSLDQEARGIVVPTVARRGSAIVFDMPNIGGKFNGQIDSSAGTIAGTWSQGGNSLPLTLSRVKDPSTLQLSRPQEPKRPYPYRDEDVTYENRAAGIKLAATLTIPHGKGPFPAALLDHRVGPAGSRRSDHGPQAIPGPRRLPAPATASRCSAPTIGASANRAATSRAPPAPICRGRGSRCRVPQDPQRSRPAARSGSSATARAASSRPWSRPALGTLPSSCSWRALAFRETWLWSNRSGP